MVLVGLFLKVLQGIQCLWALLNLVENQKCLFRQNLLPGNHRQKFDNPVRILVRLENGFQLVLFVKVKIHCAVVADSTEFLHQPRLPYLTCAFQDHRLAFFAVFPANQVFDCISFQTPHRPFFLIKQTHYITFFRCLQIEFTFFILSVSKIHTFFKLKLTAFATDNSVASKRSENGMRCWYRSSLAGMKRDAQNRHKRIPILTFRSLFLRRNLV